MKLFFTTALFAALSPVSTLADLERGLRFGPLGGGSSGGSKSGKSSCEYGFDNFAVEKIEKYCEPITPFVEVNPHALSTPPSDKKSGGSKTPLDALVNLDALGLYVEAQSALCDFHGGTLAIPYEGKANLKGLPGIESEGEEEIELTEADFANITFTSDFDLESLMSLTEGEGDGVDASTRKTRGKKDISLFAFLYGGVTCCDKCKVEKEISFQECTAAGKPGCRSSGIVYPNTNGIRGRADGVCCPDGGVWRG